MNRLSLWWRTDRPFYWIHGRWEWGWLGNGWNRLALGKIAVYFKSGSTSTLTRSCGWPEDCPDPGPKDEA